MNITIEDINKEAERRFPYPALRTIRTNNQFIKIDIYRDVFMSSSKWLLSQLQPEIEKLKSNLFASEKFRAQDAMSHINESNELRAKIDRLEKELSQLKAAPMLWYAVDKNGDEHAFFYKPVRRSKYWDCIASMLLLIPGTIKARTGKDLTWNDEPINC